MSGGLVPSWKGCESRGEACSFGWCWNEQVKASRAHVGGELCCKLVRDQILASVNDGDVLSDCDHFDDGSDFQDCGSDSDFDFDFGSGSDAYFAVD